MKKTSLQCTLDGCQLCRSCQSAWLPAIAANRTVMQFKKGSYIFRQGETLNGIFYLIEGSAKVQMHWSDERELIVRFARSGDILGHRGMGLDSVYPVSGIAMEAVTACYIPIDFFMATLTTNHDYALQMLQFFAAELKASEQKMHALILMPVRERLLLAIKWLSDKFGVDDEGCIDLTISRQDLASYIGTTYESVFRVLQDLCEEKIVKTNKKRIGLLQHDAVNKAMDYLLHRVPAVF